MSFYSWKPEYVEFERTSNLKMSDKVRRFFKRDSLNVQDDKSTYGILKLYKNKDSFNKELVNYILNFKVVLL